MNIFDASMERKMNAANKWAFIIILCIGISLRFYQYLMGRSLWEDECHLALNFINYGYLRLLKPLDYIQGAPILWIYSVKTFAKIFGYGECSLRATTFIASILSFPLFYFVTLQLTKNRIVALIGFLMFAVNGWLIYYSSELKPYSVDLSVYLLMVYLAISDNELVIKHRKSLLLIAGSASILCSSTGFIVLFCVACSMGLRWYRSRKINKSDIQILITWAIVFIINYFSFIYHHPATAQQKINFASSFLPLNIFSREFADFIDVTKNEIFFNYLLYISKSFGFGFVLLLIFIVAISYIIARKKMNIVIFYLPANIGTFMPIGIKDISVYIQAGTLPCPRIYYNHKFRNFFDS
jgi:4-amino-4-deoxy-L-arabinose transferase-like glycosyltransferase